MKMWHFIRTRWRIAMSNRWQFLLMLLLPLFVFWVAEQLLSQGSEQLKIPVIVLKEEENDTVNTIIERVKENETLQIFEKSETEAKRLLETNQAEAAVVFTEGMEEKLNQGKIEDVIQLWEAPNAISTGLIEEYIASVVIRLASNGKAATYLSNEFDGADVYEYAWQYSDDQWVPEPLMTVEHESASKPAHTQKTEKNIKPLLFGILSIYLMLISFYMQTWVMTERANGLASRTGMFGVNQLTRYLSNLLGSITVVLATLLPVSIYLLIGEGDMVQNGFLFIAYAVACSGISFFLANLFKSTLLYHLVAVAITVVTGVLGGSFFKLEEFSDRLSNASQYTPQYWFLNGLSRANTTTELTILVGLGVGLIILGLGIGVMRHDRT
ncbi:ABC transporter permease [Pseudalkalibacillus salsuginis]|uniref:ABC transporter permease n=1 Tax=Pseudalkalibacillus salsuginis TaxID=2910972 RepID=UPI001F3434B8|nr:ABC transporter permease [Pseudalkalibacillus salsuginis]MCF6410079.1 ABC transporter permease [Pseudalkalibacillus salsuginis]